MFDPLTISHDDCVNKIIEIVNSISSEQVVKAFLSSLSTRRLDWRSGIASYYIAKLITPHKYTPVESGYSYKDGKIIAVSYTCGVCKNLRYGDLLYTLFDLEQFLKEKIAEPTETDITIFKAILNAVSACKTGDYPSVLRDKLKDIPDLKSNKGERSVILEILACIGVLNPRSYDRPTSGKHDWTFVEYWRGEDGYDIKAVEKYFGKYL